MKRNLAIAINLTETTTHLVFCTTRYLWTQSPSGKVTKDHASEHGVQFRLPANYVGNLNSTFEGLRKALAEGKNPPKGLEWQDSQGNWQKPNSQLWGLYNPQRDSHTSEKRRELPLAKQVEQQKAQVQKAKHTLDLEQQKLAELEAALKAEQENENALKAKQAEQQEILQALEALDAKTLARIKAMLKK